jgi:hypothetical protein
MSELHEHGNINELPPWLQPIMNQFLAHLRTEERMLHINMVALKNFTILPDLLEVRQKLFAASDDVCQPTESEIATNRKDAEWIEKEIEKGYPLLHQHVVVSIWSALEIFCEDLSVFWLASIREAWEVEAVRKLKIQVAIFNNLDSTERARYVIHELQHELKTDLKEGLGRLEPLLDLFSLKPKVGNNLRRSIFELWQVRNNIVHCGSIVDDKLARSCPWLELKVGERLLVNHQMYAWHNLAVNRLFERILDKAVRAVGLPGCDCPGMDEIFDRPVVSD